MNSESDSKTTPEKLPEQNKQTPEASAIPESAPTAETVASNMPHKVGGPGPYLIPGAIVIAGAMIAVGAYFGMAAALPTAANPSGEPLENSNSASAENVRPVDESDHVRGAEDAKVTIIEYSDFQCPFCSRFHPTVARILSENEGDVRWVYRHFPLTNIHPEAAPSAIASECVAKLGGNDAFWSFADTMFERQDELSSALYASVAAELGIEKSAFETCLESEEIETRVRDDLQNGVDSGGRGTPFNVILTDSGEIFPFSGALPYEQVDAILSQALAR